MVRENTKIKPKKQQKKLCKENECDKEICSENRMFCIDHFNLHANDKDCNGSLKKDHHIPCNYRSSYKGFCGHHITKNDKPEPVVYDTCRKILLKISKENKTILSKCFGVSRLCYNNIVQFSKENKTNSFDGRTVVKKLDEKYNYVREIPSKIKDGAVQDFNKALSNAILKYKKVNKIQNLRFKEKYSKSDSIHIDKNAIKLGKDKKTIIIYPRVLNLVIKLDEIVEEIPTSCRITRKYGRHYYICIPQKMVKLSKEPYFVNSTVSIDPGITNFATFYSPLCQGMVGVKDSKKRLLSLQEEIDKVNSKIDFYKNKIKKIKTCKKRKKIKSKLKFLKRKQLSLCAKPTHLVQELHYKTAKFLCENFETILIPEYSSKKLSKNLRSCDNRSNQSLSHYKFRQRLFHTAKRYNRKVHIVSEAYTSMTCTNCGCLKFSKSKIDHKMLICNDCNIELHRDFRGSRNIYIKFMNWYKNYTN